MKTKNKKQHALLAVDEITQKISQQFSRDLCNIPVKQLYAGSHSFNIKENAEKALTKKYLWADVSIKDLDTEARGNFIDDCLRLELLWQHQRVRCCDDPVTARYVKTASSIVDSILGDLDEESWFSECRNSSGASIGVGFSDTSWQAKFTYPITGTISAIKLFERYLKWDTQLEGAIFELNKYSTKPKYAVVRGSRFATVPKDATKNRNIAVEPVLNMFFQQGLMGLMVKRLNMWGLSLDVLPALHTKYAWQASITLQNSTLDCKGASDSVHIDCVSKLFPPRWFGALDLIRCKEIEVIKDKWMVLPMISTMGNATTFPLETLVFYALSVTAVCEVNLEGIRSMNFRPTLPCYLPDDASLNSVSVFGDDIILPTKCADKAISILEEFGFRINTEKSFFTEYPFRESCGGDYFAGYDVRPFFLERPVDSSAKSIISWLYHIWNSLSEKYILYFGENWVYYCQDMFNMLAEQISKLGTLRIVPDNFSTTSGIRDPDPRLLINLPACTRINPIVLDGQGTVLFEFLDFSYTNQDREKNHLYIALYRALKGVTMHPKWVKKRKVGYWKESWSVGTLDLDLFNFVNAIGSKDGYGVADAGFVFTTNQPA
jgi:hypothetical protein